MRNPIGILYRLEFPSGKSYIGITTKPLKKRIRGHIRMARDGRTFLLANAIRKHGEQSIKGEVLVRGRFDYLKELEVAAIEVYRTRTPHGYNLTFGGDINPMLAPEVARKLTGKNHPYWGKKFSKSTRRKLSKPNWWKNHPPESRVCSDATRKKMSKARKLYWRRKRKL